MTTATKTKATKGATKATKGATKKTTALTKRRPELPVDVSTLGAALAACRDAGAVREIRDKAIGIESYLRARGVGVDGLADAAEVVVRAERRLGEILAELPKHPGARKGPGGTAEAPPETPTKLEELGVTKKQSKRWQDLAGIPKKDFEAALREAREKQRRITGAALLRRAKGGDDEEHEHEGAAWLDDVLHEYGWTLTTVQRGTVLAKWSESGEEVALAVLKAIAWSQWDTRDELAQLMVELAELRGDEHVLEPSAGTGAIVRAVRAAAPDAVITACEIDPDRLETLRKLIAGDVLDNLLEGDFLARDLAAEGCEVAIQNTPYENGADGLFLESAMRYCSRVVALVRTNALHGAERFERVWKRCKPSGDWGLRDLVYLASRPDFESVIADGTARSDFVVVRLDRGFHGETRVDWR